jgi:hypothetical protein
MLLIIQNNIFHAAQFTDHLNELVHFLVKVRDIQAGEQLAQNGIAFVI